ncbi:uncharacterized protein EV420DRAFT_1618767 [Desarmillaria tabescens]|uniref:Amidohydrolase-related domain-containing protein n=1 Tax=Armillaria tabescens TaxID=1929756 RepID=A0AA39NED1_ARMTA|nr:uncharacterized protein EV420DRAFT_1618767 [Desarmillaria tabescens]KAK0463928.1 hypothetical protein EV420DRAFT_1618767 [Desarmillaria tabescens]
MAPSLAGNFVPSSIAMKKVDLTLFQALPRCLLAVGVTGCVEWLVEDVEDSLVQETLRQKGCRGNAVIPLKETEFIMPGFIDTHTHAPQFPNIGSGQQYELLDWLSNVTFPVEAKFADLDFAQRTYSSVVYRIINNGTTTCCYYGTLHLEATKLLADIIKSYGQRAFVGKCSMDRNFHPAEASIDATESLIAHIRSLNPDHTQEPLVQPILTPRFAISLRIQTHISENQSEIEFTKELFPDCSSYAHVYDSFGLLRSNTVLAHARGSVHCPTSNFNLSSGVAPIGEFLGQRHKGLSCSSRRMTVGLGTDVSGGYSPSILSSVQSASIAAKVIAMKAKESKPMSGNFSDRQLSVATLLYLATLGGADVCDLNERVGSFSAGKSFDALIVNVSAKGDIPSIWDSGAEKKGKAVLEGMLERFLFCGDDRNIARVFIQGKLVGGTEF